MAYDKVSRKLETPVQTVEREAQECEARRQAERSNIFRDPGATEPPMPTNLNGRPLLSWRDSDGALFAGF